MQRLSGRISLLVCGGRLRRTALEICGDRLRRTARHLSHAAFWVWALVLFLAATSLMAGHLYALPKPERGDSAVERSLATLRDPGEERLFLAVHVLYAKCRCSLRILTHLASSERPPRVAEKLLLVGSNDDIAEPLATLARRRFEIVRVAERELAERFHVEAAPLFLVLDAEDDLLYSGGYTERKQGPDVADLRILRELLAKKSASELPVLGCAVSTELRQLLDPFAIRAREP